MVVRRLELGIRPPAPGKKVPVRVVVEKLNQLQAAVVHMGDYLTGADFRARGSSQKSVLKRCSLVVSAAHINSFHATLELEDTQTTLGGLESLGEEAIGKLTEIAECVEGGKDVEGKLGKIVADPLHRARIIDDLCSVWPSEEERMDVSLFVSGKKLPRLTSRGQLVLKGVLATLEGQGAREASVKGVLSLISVPPSEPVIRIVGPDGQVRCHYDKAFEDAAKKLIGKAATVFGEAEYDAKGEVKAIAKVTRLERFEETSLHRVFDMDRELVFVNPLPIAVEYSEGYWSMENEDLGMVTSAESYDECMRQVYAYLFFLWDEYAKEDDIKLTGDAKRLKARLLKMVGGAK